ncbi:hypothetical protein [Micromonospora aurantiaca (nom. illeg.)]|uniref:hypothetical protein n=1 Tax=Micromonospora aurantiaca (nom. illeg.) TaxID=47850 RepID=UPI003F49F5B4
MQTTIQATATDQDAADIREARRLADQLKNMLPDGMGYRNTVRRYEQVVARLGYDPIS